MNIDELKICRLNLQLTKRCNQKCKMCNSYKVKEEELTIQQICSVIQQVCEKFPIKNIAFTGGEPTLRTELLDIVRYAKRFSENVSMTTNGTYIREKSDLIALIEAGVNRFTFSYHGIGTHELYTGIPNSESKIRNALDIVYQVSQYMPIEVKIGMLLTNSTIDSIEQMIEYCRRNRFKLYIELPDHELPIFKNDVYLDFELSDAQVSKMLKIIENASSYEDVLLLDNAAKQYIRKYLFKEDIKGKCPLGYTDIYVSSNGDIYSGCWVLPAIGNIKSSSIEAIRKSEKYKENISRMINRECPNCTCGYIFQSKFII